MSSTFTWLARSESERQKALDVIDLFRERDTVDELGIGHVRDAFSELLFPGTSTIQTRAGYFLFIPWIYLSLEERRVPSAKIKARARREEIRLIDPLAESDDPEGTIGIEARESLKRLASAVYWQGLHRWGIRLNSRSRAQYHRSLDACYRTRERWESEGSEGVDGGRRPRNWHAGLPSPPESFPDETSFRLRRVDSDYLRERILSEAPATLLAFLVDEGEPFEPVDFPWQHPQTGEFPAHNRAQLLHARNFSEAMRGAPYLYNLILAELEKRSDLEEKYRSRLSDWTELLQARSAPLGAWNLEAFWECVDPSGTEVPLPTRNFVNGWLDLVLEREGPRPIPESASARGLISDRERALKGRKARVDSKRARERWNGGAGTRSLTYRWPVTQTIVLDILHGLDRPQVDARSA